MPSTKKTKSSSRVKKEDMNKLAKSEVKEEEIVEEVVIVEDEPEKEDVVVVEDEIVHISERKKFDDITELVEYFDHMIVECNSLIKNLKPFKVDSGITKTIRGHVSHIRIAKKNAVVLCKKKKKITRGGNTSGFLKPVSVSSEMQKFTGWNTDELHSRVDVTKYICDYIKNNDLQNPEDRRQIVPDSKLKKLLNIKGVMKDPLHYYNLQTHIKHHFNTTPAAT